MKKSQEINHEFLIAKARTWLKKFGCLVIASEVKISATDCPDALGWRNGFQTVLIECAASRPAFLSKKKKIESKNSVYGDYRLILTCTGVVKELSELPAAWGLLVYDPSERSITVQANAQRQVKDFPAETEILISLLRRIGEYAADADGGVSISCYKFATENRAALEVAVMGNTLEVEDEVIYCD